ncbi:N-acetylmuramic acid 6-phosphate etherase [Kroppenstedtia pulmonis]|uniref:N-acetylmuramic acid 6-phosphate etherase n=1 Tax=Kroppenstedtia pulmonis TaxID=1380685 RepID=A0A7D4BRD2_9BACL|nr:N-acetylmuramic acid 6-phosphate etherase [Kroppenstedtia pulmonis]QKG85471.1 N-acetylmuramic acid 6-phosphate etherase [Kroppenstedtia pulmonis]
MEWKQPATEGRNPRTLHMDEWSPLKVVEAINEEDRQVAKAVSRELPVIAQVVEKVIDAFQQGGRLIYIGAGTSGRLGVLDASECPPTFSAEPGMVVGLIAGGEKALRHALEGAEDHEENGMEDLRRIRLTAKDVVVAIAASGRTPYTVGALRYAGEVGACGVALVCSPHSEMSQVARQTICVEVGPEVVTGSTRMKAGTAQKMVLNMISTAAMIGIGKTYGNLMVDVQPNNQKLRERAKRIVMEVADVSEDLAMQALKQQNYQTKPAILQLMTGISPEAAVECLEKNGNKLKEALRSCQVTE